MLLEDKVDIHKPLEDEDAIQEMVEDRYPDEDPMIPMKKLRKRMTCQ